MELELFDVKQVAAAIAVSINVAPRQVERTIQLLDDGNTLPFIARYRKEITEGLDEIQLRAIEDALAKARELADRKKTVLKTIDEQGLLTPELKLSILNCDDKQLLEDIYLPYKPKRKTRATAARERGLQPLADLLLNQRDLSEATDKILQRFVKPDKDVATAEAALAGACDIVAETWAENTELRQWMHERAQRGRFVSAVKRGKKEGGEKFESYFEHEERVDRIPSHRFLAMKRGEAEGFLRLAVDPDEEYVVPRLVQRLIRNPQFAFASALKTTVEDCTSDCCNPLPSQP